jgi:hypothetical protein
MKNIIKALTIVLISLLQLGCNEESQIEGLVFSDEITTLEINKEITVIPNVNQNQAISLNINDKQYSFTITYLQIKNNNTISQYNVFFISQTPFAVLRTVGGAVYKVNEGEEITTDASYIPGSLPLIQNVGTVNTAANTIKLNEPFYLGFSSEGNSQYASFGWLKVTITNEKITIASYGYRTGKAIKAGEQ